MLSGYRIASRNCAVRNDDWGQRIDSAYWFTWYDLPEEGTGDYLAWLHEAYMPQVLARDGVLWGAHYACAETPKVSGAPGRLQKVSDADVPRGSRYILTGSPYLAHRIWPAA